MKKPSFFKCLFVTVLFLSAGSTLHAGDGENIAYAARGMGKLVGSVFAIPRAMVQGAGRSFPFGLVTGAIQGSFQTVAGVVSGTADVARGSAPYAKYAVVAAAL